MQPLGTQGSVPQRRHGTGPAWARLHGDPAVMSSQARVAAGSGVESRGFGFRRSQQVVSAVGYEPEEQELESKNRPEGGT